MMICNKLIAALFIGAMPLMANAQHAVKETSAEVHWEEGSRLCEEGHYYAAKLSLDKYLELYRQNGNAAPAADSRHVCDAEAMTLVCGYYLNSKDISADIATFLSAHPTSRHSERLTLLRANTLVKDGHYAEAVNVYQNISKENLSDAERDETMLHEAIAYIHTGDFNQAKALLTLLRGSKTHQADVLFHTGYVKYAEGDYQGALREFDMCATSDEYGTKVPVYIADCHLQTGNPQSAISIIKDFRRAYPASELSAEAKRIEGECDYELGSYNRSIALLDEYVSAETAPKRSALYRLGMSHFKSQNFSMASSLLSRSASDKRDEMAQNAWLHAGISYVNTNNKKQASMAFQQASEMPYDKTVQEEALYNYALSLHDGGTMGFGEAVPVFERFLNTYPKSKYKSSVSQHLTEVYFTTKNYPLALSSINKIKNPGREILAAKQKVLLNMGINEMNMGKHAASVDYTSRAIEVGKYDLPTYSDAHYWRGEARYRIGDYAKAFNDLNTYVNTTADKGRNYRYAHYCMGYAQFKQKNYQRAMPHFSNYVRLSSATGENVAVLSDAYNRLGDCLFDSRKDTEAYDAYKKAYETDPSQGDYSLLQLAMISGLQGRYADKIDLLSQMNTQYAASQYGADALYEQGRAYLQSGDKQKAGESFEKIIKLYPNSIIAARSGNELGALYAESGQSQKAVDTYKSVVENYPNSLEAQTALSHLKDLFTDLGRINEYAAIASKAGKSLSPAELDEMELLVAKRAQSGGNYDLAIQHYRFLREQTQSADMRIEAMTDEMRCAYESKQYDKATAAASALLADSRITPELRAESQFCRAESYYALNKPAEAVADWQALSSETRTEYGAQANVRLAEYAYNTQQYEAAEDLLLKFIESGTPHAYWLARGFILLADVYYKTDRQVEAEQYLLSLKSNYTESEEINKMIEERLK